MFIYISDNLPPPPPPTTASAPQHPPIAMPSVPTTVTMPQPAAAPIAHHHPPTALDSNVPLGGHAALRTDSPAVATSANAAVAPSSGHYHHTSYQHPPLYAPYAAATAAAQYNAPSTVPYTTVTTPYTTPTPPYTATTLTPYTSTATSIPSSIGQQPLTLATVPSIASQQPATPSVCGKVSLITEKEKQMVPPPPRGPSPVRENRERESYR